MRKVVLPILSRLRRLMLVLAGSELEALNDEGDGHTFGHPEDPYTDDNIMEAGIRRFLMSTPNLSHLRLNFDRHEYLGFRLVPWLSRPASITLPNLKCLDLGTSSFLFAMLMYLSGFC